MVYRITVDGERKYAEAPIKEYSTQADNLAREGIIKHFLEEGACEVIFDTSMDEAKQIHEIAEEFCLQLMEFEKVWLALPYDHPWGIDEFEILIPEFMKIYMKAMKLPDPECVEDRKHECDWDYCTRNTDFGTVIDMDKDVDEKYAMHWFLCDPFDRDVSHTNPDCVYEISNNYLADDFGDVIIDLGLGLCEYQAGNVCSAIFQWKFNLFSHYGDHITSALRAMCSAWENAKRDQWLDEIGEKDYWESEEDI